MNYIALAAPAILVAILVTTVSFMDTHIAFATGYEKSQIISQVNECGNYWFPINVVCSNINSQIQGDENNVAVTAEAEKSSKNFGPPFP
jgi:hypothetical protein